MKILVTGAKGFIGKNLVVELRNRSFKGGPITVFEYDTDTEVSLLEQYTRKAEFVFHLAGVNRPEKQQEFMEGNFGFTSTLLNMLKKNGNGCPVVFASSIQVELSNPYGESKRAGENAIINHGLETGARVIVFRLPNVFGKWCRPNYNSVVATFCHNIARDLPIQINNPDTEMKLVYIDDVVDAFLSTMEESAHRDSPYLEIPIVHGVKLGGIAELLYSFRKSREDRSIPDMSDAFTKKLYSTYLSYLPKEQFGYDLKMNADHRGSFTEFLKTPDRGQISVNISKPGITKGNHWHHTKNEKFLVVSGKGVIRFRRIDSEEITQYYVSGDKMQVIDIPVGYTHNIENLGDTDMVTIMWANECFSPQKPDTYFLEV